MKQYCTCGRLLRSRLDIIKNPMWCFSCNVGYPRLHRGPFTSDRELQRKIADGDKEKSNTGKKAGKPKGLDKNERRRLKQAARARAAEAAASQDPKAGGSSG